MKQIIQGLLVACLAHLPLSAEEPRWEDDCDESNGLKIWEISSSALITAPSDFENAGHQGQQAKYGEADLYIKATLPIDLWRGFQLSVSTHYTYIDWAQNTYFEDNNFHDLSLSLAAYTLSWQDWFWRAGFECFVDADHIEFRNYAKYRGLLWGRYTYTDCLGLHIGMAGGTGLHEDYIYPILGLDYQPFCDWKVSIILPLEASVVYSVTDWIDLEVSARRFRARHRVGEDEVLSRAIFEYRAYGVELGATAQLYSSFTARFFAGSCGGGELEVMNNRGIDQASFELDGTVYVGGKIALAF